MTAFLLVLGFLICCAASYAGVLMIASARREALAEYIAHEKAAMQDEERRALKLLAERAHVSDGLVRAIAEYDALDRMRVN